MTSKYEQRYFKGYIYYFLSQVPPDLLLSNSADRIAREFCWSSQFIPCRYYSTMVLHAQVHEAN
jgi:hypothetical protein